jgi:hypothetical protein
LLEGVVRKTGVPDLDTSERSQLYRSLLNQTNTLQPAVMRVMYAERYGDTGVREAAVADAHEQSLERPPFAAA